MATARWRIALAALAVTAAAASLLTSWWLFPLYSVNRDDSVYVAMARLLQQGAVTLPAAEHEFFRPWASGVVGDRLVLKYTPPWPAVLAAADVLTGTFRLGPALTAAGAVVALTVLAAEVLRDRAAAVVAGALFVLSPVVVVQSGTYLPYLFQLLLGLVAAVLLLTGTRRRSSARLVAAGAVLGVAAFARPFDTLLVALPFLVLVLLDPRAGGPDGAGWTRHAVLLRLAAGGAPLLALSLLYNGLVMGHPLHLPFTVTGPQDTFGFGERGVFPRYTVPFTPEDGVTGMLDNLRWLPSWTAGGALLVLLAAAGLLSTRGRARWAVAALAAVVPLGYLPFYGPYAMSSLWEGVQSLGPFYHLPVLVPLVVLGAAGLAALARRARATTAAVLAAMAALTALAVPDKVALNAEVRDDYRAVQQLVADAGLDRAVLFLPRRGDLGFVSTTPFLENLPSLRQPVLYAEDRGPEDLELAARHPDRELHRLSEDLPPGETTGGPLTLDRLRVEAGALVTLRLRLTNPTDRPVAVAYLTDGRGVRTRTLDRSSSRGRTYDVSWTVAAPGTADAALGDTVRLPAGRDEGVLAIGLDLRSPEAPDEPGARWERRVAYRVPQGAGRVELLRPGQAWVSEADGTGWVQRAAGHAVEDVG